jgi:hypothetical protein
MTDFNTSSSMLNSNRKTHVFIIETKDDKVLIRAKDKDHAFAKFFKDVMDEKVPLEKLGSIVILSDGKNEYPFRIAPLLWQMKLISGDVAVSNIMAVTGVSQKEAEGMLLQMSFKDSRLIPLIEELRREEKK